MYYYEKIKLFGMVNSYSIKNWIKHNKQKTRRTS